MLTNKTRTHDTPTTFHKHADPHDCGRCHRLHRQHSHPTPIRRPSDAHPTPIRRPSDACNLQGFCHIRTSLKEKNNYFSFKTCESSNMLYFTGVGWASDGRRMGVGWASDGRRTCTATAPDRHMIRHDMNYIRFTKHGACPRPSRRWRQGGREHLNRKHGCKMMSVMVYG